MKCTLRKTEQGVVATIDERPKMQEYYCYIVDFQVEKRMIINDNYYNKNFHTIIASTFGVGKELVIPTKTNLSALIWDNNCNDGEYDYTETETQIIIQL